MLCKRHLRTVLYERCQSVYLFYCHISSAIMLTLILLFIVSCFSVLYLKPQVFYIFWFYAISQYNDLSQFVALNRAGAAYNYVPASTAKITIPSDNLTTYNILLLGQSGVGKTMFINSFINYVQHETLAEAQRNIHQLTLAIPVTFTITDSHGIPRLVNDGPKDNNEILENTAHSSTTECRSYLIMCDNFKIRLIDSAGVSSTVIENDANRRRMDSHQESVEQDNKYVDNVLEFIGQFDDLHAIVIVVKSNETRYNPQFESSLKLLLSSFNKSAVDNLFFLLTFGECARFKADVARAPLKTLLANVTQSTSDELLSKNKVYTVDNTCTRYLVAVKNRISLDNDEKIQNRKAWKQSRDECRRLIDYIIGKDDQPKLRPHRVTDTLSIKVAKKFIYIIEDLIKEIVKTIKEQMKELDYCINNFEKQTQNKLLTTETIQQMNMLDIEITKLTLPKTTCTSLQCAPIYTVNGEQKTHYGKICCDGCRVEYLKRIFCKEFRLFSGECRKCGCHSNVHKRIFFKTEIVRRNIIDTEAKKRIMSALDDKQTLEITMECIIKQRATLITERTAIESAQGLFSEFLEATPIIPSGGTNGRDAVPISPGTVFVLKEQLFRLEIFGPRIKKAYGISEQGEKSDWLAIKETIIPIRNTFQNWYAR